MDVAFHDRSKIATLSYLGIKVHGNPGCLSATFSDFLQWLLSMQHQPYSTRCPTLHVA